MLCDIIIWPDTVSLNLHTMSVGENSIIVDGTFNLILNPKFYIEL